MCARTCENTIFNILAVLSSPLQTLGEVPASAHCRFGDVVSEHAGMVKHRHYGTSVDKNVKYSTKRSDP